MDHKNYLNNNTNLNHILKITGSISLITLLAFSQRGVLQAEEVVVPTTTRLNLEPLNVNYNDTRTIANVAKTILKDHVNLLSELTELEKDSQKAVYALEDYIITVYYDAKSGLGVRDVRMTIQTKMTSERKENQKLLALNDQSSCEIVEGMISEYNILINVKDNVAPKIKLSKNSVTIKETDDFDIDDYVKSVSDNVDGKLSYSVDGKIKKDGDNYVPGKYTLTVKAKDSSGNTSSKKLTVKVEKKKKKNVSNSSQLYYSRSTDTSGYTGASDVLNAAYAQLGRRQDCTMLVTNALASAGIQFHGWPAEYYALGHSVSASEARPGDLIYYADGGMGMAHIALYVGNGKAIHGGWTNGSTVLASAEMGSGANYIRIDK